MIVHTGTEKNVWVVLSRDIGIHKKVPAKSALQEEIMILGLRLALFVKMATLMMKQSTDVLKISKNLFLNQLPFPSQK